MVYLEYHGFTMRVKNHGKHGKYTMVIPWFYHGINSMLKNQKAWKKAWKAWNITMATKILLAFSARFTNVTMGYRVFCVVLLSAY